MENENIKNKVKLECANCGWYFWADERDDIVDCPKCGWMVNTEEDKAE